MRATTMRDPAPFGTSPSSADMPVLFVDGDNVV